MKFNITFNDAKNKELGRLEEGDDGQLTYTGNIDEGAEIFFDAVVKLNSKALKDMQQVINGLANG